MVIPKNEITNSREMKKRWEQFNTGAERIYQQLLQDIGTTSDSATLLREVRQDRAAR